jgi:hypothetical protein
MSHADAGCASETEWDDVDLPDASEADLAQVSPTAAPARPSKRRRPRGSERGGADDDDGEDAAAGPSRSGSSPGPGSGSGHDSERGPRSSWMQPQAVFSDAAVPKLMNMRDLIAQHGYLSNCTHSDQPARKDKTSNTSASFLAETIKSAGAASAAEQMAGASQIDPWQSQEYRRAREQLTAPAFFDKKDVTHRLSQPQLHALLRSRQYKLCVQTASLESSLLVESGSWRTDADSRTRNFPACSLGDKCVGMQREYWIRNQRRGVVWTSMMFDYEWAEFMVGSVYMGERRMCVLDQRRHIPSFITKRRLIRMKGATGSASDLACTESSPDDILQLYHNTIDCDGGYFNQYVLLPEPGEAMIEPLVRMNRFTTVAVHLASGQMKADQSQIVYRADGAHSQPTPGENMGSF